MKKALIIALLLLPSAASAAPVTGDYFDATDANATSTFAGSFGVGGKFIFDSITGFLGVGTTTRYNANAKWEFVAETTASGGVSLVTTNYSNSQTPVPALIFRGARGTQASPSALTNGDTLGLLAFNGFDGVSFVSQSPTTIRGFAAENWSSSAHGADLAFFTTPTGGVTRIESMRLRANGNLGIATATPAFPLDIFSNSTTTFRIDSGSSDRGSCIAMKDYDGVGYSYITVNNGGIFISTTPCN
jgi:hypothetical protein